jgi:hypothetical protein
LVGNCFVVGKLPDLKICYGSKLHEFKLLLLVTSIASANSNFNRHFFSQTFSSLFPLPKDVFRQMIEYIHTGAVTLQPRTLLGVMNAADYYGLEELKRACNGFVQQGCITVDTVCALLSSAERYIHFKCTKSLVQRVLEFVDEHGEAHGNENAHPKEL